MVFTISLIATIVIALAVIGTSFFGLLRGWKRMVVTVGRTLCAIPLAYFSAKLLEMLLPMESIFDALVQPLLRGDDFWVDLFSASPTLHSFLSYLPAALVTPTLFVLLFCIFDLLLLIPSHFVNKALEKKFPTPTEGKGKIINMWTGVGVKFANSIIVMMVVLLPLSGIITTVGNGIYEVRHAFEETNATFEIKKNGEVVYDLSAEELDSFIGEYVDPIAKNPIFAMSANPLFRLMYTNLTEVNLHGDNAFLDKELQDVFTLAADCACFFTDPDGYGEAQKQALDHMIGYVADSKYKTMIASEMLSEMANSWKRGDEFMGIEKPGDKHAMIIIDPMIEILSESTPEAVHDDLTTFSDILCIMIDYDLHVSIIESLETENLDTKPLIKEIANSEMLGDILEEIYENEDYHDMIQPVIKMFFRTVLDSFVDEASIHISDAPPALNAQQIREEGIYIAAMLLDVMEFVDSMPENQNEYTSLELITKLNVPALGKFYDDSQHSLLLGEGIKETFVAILSSDMLKGIEDIGTILKNHIENDKDLNMQKMLTATQELANIFKSYENGAGTTDMVALTKSLNSLINSVDAPTAEIINEMIDSGAFGSTVVSNENDNKVTEMIGSAINSMSKLENLTEEELEKEAKALDYLMKIANAASPKKENPDKPETPVDPETPPVTPETPPVDPETPPVTPETPPVEPENPNDNPLQDFKDIFVGEGDNSDEMVDVILSSKIASDVINDIAYDEEGNLNEDALEIAGSIKEEEKDSIIASVEKYYKDAANEKNEDSTKTEQDIKEELETLKNNINAIAAIFGKNLTEDFTQWDTDIFG